MDFNINVLRNKVIRIIKVEGIIPLLKRPFRKFKTYFYVRYLKIKIRKFDKNYTIDSLIDFIYNSCEGLISPLQIRNELLKFLNLLKSHKPKYILEIGTASGGTLFLFSRIASKDAVIISVDLPGGKHGGGYPSWKIPLYEAFVLSGQKIHLIRANSHYKSTLNKVINILKDKKLDLLFIDGDHSYEGVKKDFEMYNALVNDNGIIAFHDIVEFRPKNTNLDVYKFWNEIKVKYNFEEYVEDKNQNWAGIGILNEKKG